MRCTSRFHLFAFKVESILFEINKEVQCVSITAANRLKPDYVYLKARNFLV